MRDGRIAIAPCLKQFDWKLVIAVICGVWLMLTIGASYFGYEHKSPVRIESWKPEPAR